MAQSLASRPRGITAPRPPLLPGAHLRLVTRTIHGPRELKLVRLLSPFPKYGSPNETQPVVITRSPLYRIWTPVFLLLLGGLGLPVTLMIKGWWFLPIWAALIPLGSGLLFLLRRYTRWFTTIWIITPTGLYIRSGFFRVKETPIDPNDITGVQPSRPGFSGTFFNIGDITVSTAAGQRIQLTGIGHYKRAVELLGDLNRAPLMAAQRSSMYEEQQTALMRQMAERGQAPSGMPAGYDHLDIPPPPGAIEHAQQYRLTDYQVTMLQKYINRGWTYGAIYNYYKETFGADYAFTISLMVGDAMMEGRLQSDPNFHFHTTPEQAAMARADTQEHHFPDLGPIQEEPRLRRRRWGRR